MNCLIVGTGPSIKEITKEIDAEYVISVNQSIRFLWEPNVWFTLDPSPRNLEVYEHFSRLYKATEFVFAVGDHTVLHNSVTRLKRLSRSVENPTDAFERWGCIPRLSEDETSIHTGNSVWGALQFAYWKRPKKILILGLDGNQQPSFGSNHSPNDLSHLPRLFESSVSQLTKAGIEVVVGSQNSSIDCFPRMNPNDGLEWLNK